MVQGQRPCGSFYYASISEAIYAAGFQRLKIGSVLTGVFITTFPEIGPQLYSTVLKFVCLRIRPVIHVIVASIHCIFNTFKCVLVSFYSSTSTTSKWATLSMITEESLPSSALLQEEQFPELSLSMHKQGLTAA